jgi:glutamate racemase
LNLQPIVPAVAASSRERPIGVFDSGIGGLSVLRALQAQLPHERFVYFADTAHGPYGERSEAYVMARTRTAVANLAKRHALKALVVACNTATAAAIHLLRSEHAGLAVIGVEPALKPAVAASRTRRIAVLATRGTLASAKFSALHAALGNQASFELVACDGLASAIEADDRPQIAALCTRYVHEAGLFGTGEGQIDTMVLGCTHYPFAAVQLRDHAGESVQLIDSGAAVAQQTRRVLDAAGLLAEHPSGDNGLLLESSGNVATLASAARRWLAPADAAVA